MMEKRAVINTEIRKCKEAIKALQLKRGDGANDGVARNDNKETTTTSSAGALGLKSRLRPRSE